MGKTGGKSLNLLFDFFPGPSALGLEIQKRFCISCSFFFPFILFNFFSNFSILYYLKYRTANEIKMTLSYESHFDAKDFGSYNLLQSDSVFLHERDTITMKQGNLIH